MKENEKDRKKDKKARWSSNCICSFCQLPALCTMVPGFKEKKRRGASLSCLEAVSLVVSPGWDRYVLLKTFPCSLGR